MWKRITSSLAATCLVGAALLPPLTAHADTALHKGDTVQYTFTVGQCDNVAGISVDSYYDAEFLTLSGEPVFMIGGQGLSNTNELGKVRWNTMINGGRAFADEDILVESFTVNKACTLEDAKLSFECIEIFNHDLQILSADLITARVDVIETGEQTDEETDTDSLEPASSEISRAESSVSSVPEQPPRTYSTKPVNVSSTDLTPSDEEDIDPTSPENAATRSTVSRTASRTSSVTSNTSSKPASQTSSKTSSAASSSKSTSSVKPETATTPQSAVSSAAGTSSAVSKTSSTQASSKSASVSAAASSKTPGSTAAVSTAGRIAIAAVAAIFAAAGVVLVLAKKLKTTE